MPFVPLLAAPAPAQIPAPGAAALRVDDRVGFVRENGRVRLHFGGFPLGKPVQADGLARRAAAFRNGALAGRNGNPETGNAAARRLECR